MIPLQRRHRITFTGFAGVINMKQFYSKSTKGFYVEGIHKTLPEDVVEITEAERSAALDGQKDGGSIQGGTDGKPVVVTPTPAELLATLATEARAKRNALLAASDWTQVSDAPVDQAAWANYRQALRDITDQVGFPETIVWPVEP